MITGPLAVLAVLAIVVTAMIWMERFAYFRKFGAAAGTLVAGMALSNLGVIPGDSAVYGFFSGYGVLAGTALILLSVNLKSVRAAGPVMLKAFFLGAFGSMIGALVMGYMLTPSLGDSAYKLSGQFAATYIGGGVNFAAVGQAFGTASDIFSAGIAADVIVTAIWLVICLTAPIFLGSPGGNSEPDAHPALEDPEGSTESGKDHGLFRALYNSGRPLMLKDIGIITAFAVVVIWSSSLLADLIPLIPAVLWLTTIALILAQLPFARNLAGATITGHYLILMFLACNGAQSVVANIVEVGPEIFYFAAGTVAIHGVITFGIGRLMKIDAGTLVIASQANVGGSTSAMAIATARGYPDRILPGIAVGLIGIALGNYIGLGVGNLLRVLV